MGVTKKIGAATNSRKKGGELICKNFGVNGKVLSVHVPIAHNNCLGINFQLHAHLLHKRIVSK